MPSKVIEMAKTYIDIVKYMVEARFEILGSVEKPDIIGAVFGQTEGLLGADLDLRELQKNGKIGRIEIESASSNNKTYGKLLLPSSLGKVETCILAAAIESVDRVGPFETAFKIEKISDTREEKRVKVINRAKELVKNLLENVIPDSKEISELVESDVKSSTVTHYGPDNLPAGPDIAKSDSIIIVEGRADVVNLLKNDITNCVAVGGATGTIPKTVVDLCGQKDVTLFLDGDRGGDIIFKSISNVAEVDYIARAPDGKEVEELTRKEIIKALRSRVPFEQTAIGKAQAREEHEHEHEGNNHSNHYQPQQKQYQQQRQRYGSQRTQQSYEQQPAQKEEQERSQILSPTQIAHRLSDQTTEPNGHDDAGALTEVEIDKQHQGIAGVENIEFAKKQPPQESEKYISALAELKNTLRGRLYDSSGKLISEVPIRELMQAIQEAPAVSSIVFDGIITQRLVDLANSKSAKAIYGIRASQISRKYDSLFLYTQEG